MPDLWKKCGTRREKILHEAFHREDNKIACFQCEELFEHYFQFDKHMTVHLINCESCEEKFLSREYYEEHRKSEHKSKEELETFTCEICRKDFKILECFQAHLITHFLSCSFCETKVPNFQTVKCDICKKKCKSQRILRKHRKVHNLHAKTCYECGQEFLLSAYYEMHCTSVHNRVPYKCDVCARIFVTQKNLIKHKKKHLRNALYARIKTEHRDNNRFVCGICSEGFFLKDLLNLHMQSHNPLKNDI